MIDVNLHNNAKHMIGYMRPDIDLTHPPTPQIM